MKLNNKLFLITATLGLMAAGSATAFADYGHPNYVYVTNMVSSTIFCTEYWKHDFINGNIYTSEGQELFTANGEPTSMDAQLIKPGTTGIFKQEAELENKNGNIDPDNATNYGKTYVSILDNSNGIHYGTVSIEYHQYWVYSNLDFNHLVEGTIINTYGYVYIGNTNANDVDTANQSVTCSDQTHFHIYVGAVPNTNSSPMGKLSSVIQNFKI